MVKAWREIVTIPTYEIGKPEKAPMFLEKRVYQGSSGVVYPYPVIESISDEKMDKDYKNNGNIKWNFTKFLIDREGNIVARFEPTMSMDKVRAAVEAAL